MVEFLPNVAPTAGWVVLVVAGLIIGITKTGIPGIGILAVVSVASVMNPKASVGFVLPMLITGDIFAVVYYRRHAVWRHLLRLLPPALAGILVGYWLLGRIESDELGPIIGRAWELRTYWLNETPQTREVYAEKMGQRIASIATVGSSAPMTPSEV
jgi:hypothetical protein